MALRLDRERFRRRLGTFYKFWCDEDNALLSGVSAVSFILGNDDVQYSKTASMQTWLFGYELADSLVLLTKSAVYFLGSPKKIEFLKPAESDATVDGVPPVKSLLRNKADKDAQNFDKLVDVIKQSDGAVLGHFAKDRFKTAFIDGWAAAVDAAGIEKRDVSAGVALVMAPKEESEIDLIKQACHVSCQMWNKMLRTRIVQAVDKEKKVKHETLADEVDKSVTDRKVIGGISTEPLQTCYTPVIQSGGRYNLKLSAVSDKHTMQFDAIVCSFGARYNSYCSNVSRTMVVSPTKDVELALDLLIKAEDALIAALRPGARLADVHAAAVAVVRDGRPDLVDKMTNNFGFATGLEFRESNLQIGPAATETVREKMVFIVRIGFGDLSTASASGVEPKQLALLVSDTVLVGADATTCLTEAAKRAVKSSTIRFQDQSDAEEDNKENVEELLGRGKRSVVLQEQTRNKMTNEEKRMEHQRQLAAGLNEAARQRIARSRDKTTEPKLRKSNVSYKRADALPDEKEVRSLQVYVDRKSESVVVPIFGVPVPFHVSMIKNLSQTNEGDFSYLRINFFHPGSTIGKETNVFPHPLATFVKEITYRSSNQREPGELQSPSTNLVTAGRLIKDMQKRFRTRETEEREKEGVVKQDKLLLSQNKANPRLKDLYVRPNIISKRITGTFEAHLNGFRYTSIRGDKVDIMYNNVKHAFFQPCDKEMIIMLHFHLKNAVLFGKKKQIDIQFYTEVGEITTDLGKYHHMQDRDDIYAEQAERELRHKLDLAFKSFCEKVERQTNGAVDFDTPFRDLGFNGVPHRQAAFVQPTSSCLVNLTEWPPFVVTLEEVELVHFERVSLQLKNFDMVFVFKNYSRKPEMIQQISMGSLDNIKEWLNSCDIRYTEGIQSLNWQKIMKTIVDDPDEFFESGGWNFLGSESDDGEQEQQDSDEDDDEFNPTDSDDDEADAESDDDDESPEPSGSDDSASEASGSDEEESGKDWSDLEQEAAKADKERGEDDDDEEERRRKRKHGSPHKSRAPPPKRRR